MALGDADAIIDNFTARGIGTSGLASRKIQQGNIESLNSLRGNLIDSQSRNDAERKKLINMASLQQINNSTARIGGTINRGVRELADGVKQTVTIGNNSDNGKNAFSVGVEGESTIKQFQNVGEILDFLRSRNLTPDKFNVVGTDLSKYDEMSRGMLESAGVQFLNRQGLKQLTGYKTETGFGGGGTIKLNAAVDRKRAKELEVPPLYPAPVGGIAPTTIGRPLKPITSLREIIGDFGKGYRK